LRKGYLMMLLEALEKLADLMPTLV